MTRAAAVGGALIALASAGVAAADTVSGELDTIRLVTLGKAYDADTGELVLKNGVVKTATP